MANSSRRSGVSEYLSARSQFSETTSVGRIPIEEMRRERRRSINSMTGETKTEEYERRENIRLVLNVVVGFILLSLVITGFVLYHSDKSGGNKVKNSGTPINSNIGNRSITSTTEPPEPPDPTITTTVSIEEITDKNGISSTPPPTTIAKVAFPCAGITDREERVFESLDEPVICEDDSILIQERTQHPYMYFNFNKGWKKYEAGLFWGGNGLGNYWVGLKSLHFITAQWECDLEIELKHKDTDQTETYKATYNNVTIGSEDTYYKFSYGEFSESSTLSDGMKAAQGIKFSTKDADHDDSADTSLAKVRSGGWWHTVDSTTNLNGDYQSTDSTKGVFWGNVGNEFMSTKMTLKLH